MKIALIVLSPIIIYIINILLIPVYYIIISEKVEENKSDATL